MYLGTCMSLVSVQSLPVSNIVLSLSPRLKSVFHPQSSQQVLFFRKISSPFSLNLVHPHPPFTVTTLAFTSYWNSSQWMKTPLISWAQTTKLHSICALYSSHLSCLFLSHVNTCYLLPSTLRSSEVLSPYSPVLPPQLGLFICVAMWKKR